MDMQRIDPFSFGFFEDETAELCERVGRALVSGARHVPISFGKHIMPSACASMPHGGAGFTFSTGLIYDHTKTSEMIAQYPDHTDIIREYEAKFRPFTEAVQLPETEKHRALAETHAEWGGSWGGHSNPDFGMIVNLGTEGVRTKIAECAKAHPESEPFYRGCSHAMDMARIVITDAAGQVVQTSICHPVRRSCYAFDMSQFVTDSEEQLVGKIDVNALPAGAYHCLVTIRTVKDGEFIASECDFTV